MKFRTIFLLFMISLLESVSSYCQVGKEMELEAAAIWEKISPHFSVPEEYEDEYGEFSSPLRFFNGRPVKTKEDWRKRRKEILSHWHEMMGHWPSLITDQKLEILDSDRKENFVQHRVRFNWLPGQQTEGYLLIPDGAEEKPAVLTVEPESAIGLSDIPNRDFAYQLAKRGFVTLSIGTTDTTTNRTYSLYYPDIDNAQVQPLSMLAYAAANAWNVLVKVDGVNPDRIGIVGHSFGGKWAMFASALYDKFAAAAWSDPGIVFDESRAAVNYWEPWYLGYHPKPWRERGIITEANPAKGLYLELVKNNYDLTDLHALMAPRPFLVSGGAEDPPARWKALNHSIAVNDFLGYKNKVAMTNRPEHSPNKESNEQIYLFFEYFLKHNKL